jgi:hypothetical protein
MESLKNLFVERVRQINFTFVIRYVAFMKIRPMSVFGNISLYFVHTKARSVLHWIYKVVVRKPEKNCWYQIIKSIRIYYTLSYCPLQMTGDT